MLSVEAMVTKDYTVRQWLTYYKNIWTRNLAARLIDVKTDQQLKAKDPNGVTDEAGADGRTPKSVKVRLEERKLAVQDSVDILAGIDAMLALTPEELTAAAGAEALKVDADMIPLAPAPVEEKKEPADEEKKDEEAAGAKAPDEAAKT